MTTEAAAIDRIAFATSSVLNDGLTTALLRSLRFVPNFAVSAVCTPAISSGFISTVRIWTRPPSAPWTTASG